MKRFRIGNAKYGKRVSRIYFGGLIFAVSLVASFVTSRDILAEDRPNIVFLFADDQCTYSMGCYGTPGAKTPNLDQLASEGVVFDRHYVSTAICMASRACVMTGLYEYRHGTNFTTGNMVQSIWEKSYPMLLRESGYRTAFAGKFGFVVSQKAGSKGKLPEDDFDRWGGGPGQTSYVTEKNESMKEFADEYPHSTRSYGAFGADFIQESAKGDAPFCLSISFKAPHHPVTPDPMFKDVYSGSVFVKPENFGREFGQHFAVQSRQGRQFERFYSWNYADKYQETMALYYQQIYAIDYAVGMIREALQRAGCDDNTVIIYSSDNGFMCGSHGYGSKVLPYEESSCVPLIISDPRRTDFANQRCDELTCNVDIHATILDLAGVEGGNALDGKSLLPLLENTEQPVRESVPLINVWGPKAVHSFAVVTEEGKWIYWPFEDEFTKPVSELYDMKSDRLELKNLHRVTGSEPLSRKMRFAFSRELTKWRERCVSFHGYPRFSTIFDPEESWETKAKLYSK